MILNMNHSPDVAATPPTSVSACDNDDVNVK